MSTLASSARLRNALNRRLGDYQPMQIAFTGVMGDGAGNVTVAGRANYVYVRRTGRGRIEEVLNVRLAHRSGLPVIVGYAPEDPEELQVLSVDTAAVSALDNYRYSPPHHDAHEFGSAVGGDDVVWVQKPQYVPLHCHPTDPTSMLVEVEDDFYPWGVGWNHFDGDTIDLTASIPPGGLWATSRFVLISIDGATNALQLTNGAIFATALPPSPIWTAIPAPPAGSVPVAAALLNGATVTVTWDEIYDVRIHNTPVGGSVLPAAHPILNTTYHSDTATQTVSRGSLIYGNVTPAWDELTIGVAGAALYSDGADVSWTTTPTWTGLHTFNAGITFGGGSGTNVVTVPDNVAQALNLVDAGGLEYLRIVSTDVQPIVHWNQGQVDVDFRIDWDTGIAAFVEGSTGRIGMGGVTAPSAQVHIDQASATAAVPTLFLDQGDVSEQCIKFSSDSTDRDIYLWTVDVTGTPTLMWDESNDAFYLNKYWAVGDAGHTTGCALTATISGTGTIVGGVFETYCTSAVADAGQHIGYMGSVILTGAGNLTAGFAASPGNCAAYIRFQHRSSAVVSGAKLSQGRVVFVGAAATGSVTQAAVFYVQDAANTSGATGSIGTYYGLYIENLAFATNNYPIYSLGGNSYHAGRFAFGGTVAAAGQVHIDQSSATGAIPVILLDQADVSEEFIRLIGYAAAATLTQSLVNEADVTTATRIGWFKVYIRDDGNQITDGYYYVPFFTLT